MIYPPSLVRLIEALRCLPGVGPKSAQRMAFHLLEKDRNGAGAAGRCAAEGSRRRRALPALSHVRRCASCVRSARRRRAISSLLCVVESPADVAAIEQSGSYRGTYFVLMGHLSPLDGIGPDELGFAQLEALLAEGSVKEAILATNTTVEGDATAHVIAELAHASQGQVEPHRARRAGRRRARVRRRRHARARAGRDGICCQAEA